MDAGMRIARLSCGQERGYLAVDNQEWTFKQRRLLRIERRTEVRERWRFATESGEYDEGFLSSADLGQLLEHKFAYRGSCFEVSWLTAEEAGVIEQDYFDGWE